MPATIEYSELSADQLLAVRLVLDTLGTSLNLPTGTRVAAVAQTASGLYAGAQLQLTLPSAVHAEVAAIGNAHSAGDLDIHTLYLASRRVDGRDPGHVMPCGSCCQLIHDLAEYTDVPVTVMSLNHEGGAARVVTSAELLPHAFSSQKLRDAGAQRQLMRRRAPTSRPVGSVT